jgi:hypothetical protein
LYKGIGGFGSSAPLILGTLALPEELGVAGALGIGSLLGLGGQKGQNYQEVYDKAKEAGMSEEKANQLAMQAQEYSPKNAASLGLGAGLGALEGVAGLAPIVGKYFKPTSRIAAKTGVNEPTLAKAALTAIGENAGTELLQGGGAQLGANLALQGAGFDTPLMSGVVGAGAHDALIGALTGTAVTPLQLNNMKREYDQGKIKEELEQQEAQRKENEERQRVLQEQMQKMGANQKLLALPAPAQEIKEEPTDVLHNPLGNFTAEELGPERTKFIDEHRKANGKPSLNTYSI